MWDEVIDFADSYDSLVVGAETKRSEIRDYYLAEALLQIPLSHETEYHYYNMVDDAVFE